jgi:TonB family protein
MNPANVLAYLAQVTIVVLVCAGLPRLLGLRSPGVHYAFWRTVLVVCLLLPIVQPWQPASMTFVPAPGPPPPAADGPVSRPAPAPRQAAASIDWFAALQVAAAAGVSLRLAWLALGAIRLRRLRRGATDAAIGFDDLKSAIGAAPPILWSSAVRHPVTFGVFRPVILLPAAIKAIDLPAQRAIVAHELHHVRRRDWSWVIAEEVVRSVFWFHPAMWWLVSRVQLARETVVDELSILATNARRTYLDTLLAFADDTGLVSSPAFSARRHLFHRVMLLSKEGGMSSFRIAITSCALLAALAAGSWTAVNAFPLHGAAVQDQAPPRDPVAVDNVRRAQEFWEKATKDTSLTREQKRDTVLKGIAAADRALTANPYHRDALIWKTALLRLQALDADPAERETLIRDAEILRKVAVAVSESEQTGAAVMEFMPREYKEVVDRLMPVRLGGEIKPPKKLYDVRPVYPPIAQVGRVEGVVIVEGVLDAGGRVAAVRVVRSIPLLDEAALEAVRQWQFEPPLVDGQPRAVLMTTTVNFKLQ